MTKKERRKYLKSILLRMETDLIELMKCKNCLNFDNGICKIKLEEKGLGKEWQDHEKVKPDDSCAFWVENINKQNELKSTYLDLKDILKEFVDMKEENYEIIALWIMGTWLHDYFPTYPYLFINAMKGSGKTRLLKLIKELSKEGDMLASLSEAVLFRTTGTLCIDEFENISGKDKHALRELLNTAYKKGGKVKRMRKRQSKEGEEQVVEEFNTFRPIVMANISGLEEVLEDRCISIILEKSNNPTITRKIENFSDNPNIQKIKQNLQNIKNWCREVCVGDPKTMYIEWNIYITTIHSSLPSLNNTPLHTFFNKIIKTNINGRNLELTFPLFLIAEEIGVLENIIETIKNIIEEKSYEDVMEGRDVMLMDFVSRQIPSEYHKINNLTNNFRRFINYELEDERNNWLINKWMGIALKRLNLIYKKRRLGSGVEVILDVEKANDKMKIFRPKNENLERDDSPRERRSE